MTGPTRIWMTPLRIVLIYAAFGAAWIVLSDTVLELLVPSEAHRAALQSFKGILYVLATGVLLFGLLQRQEAERRLRDEEVRAVLQSMADAVLVVDQQLRVTDVNEAALRLLGAPDRHALLVPLPELLARMKACLPDGRAVLAEETTTACALRGETVVAREVWQRADGRALSLSVSSAPVSAAGKPPRCAVTVVRDVTDLTRFEEAREEFISAAAHEFRTPLAVVKAYAQLMARRGQGDREALTIIDRQVARLTRMLQHLLDVSRFRLGGAELRREPFDVAALVREVADGLQLQATGHTIVVVATPAVVQADRSRIEQVVSRLIENALQFSPPGGRVEAAVARDATEALISVRDHGPGIPPERRQRVFDRGYGARGRAAETATFGGGLDVSREIVARHGGRMWLESEVGRGSTFSFSLPLASSEQLHASA